MIDGVIAWYSKSLSYGNSIPQIITINEFTTEYIKLKILDFDLQNL